MNATPYFPDDIVWPRNKKDMLAHAVAPPSAAAKAGEEGTVEQKQYGPFALRVVRQDVVARITAELFSPVVGGVEYGTAVEQLSEIVMRPIVDNDGYMEVSVRGVRRYVSERLLEVVQEPEKHLEKAGEPTAGGDERQWMRALVDHATLTETVAVGSEVVCVPPECTEPVAIYAGELVEVEGDRERVEIEGGHVIKRERVRVRGVFSGFVTVDATDLGEGLHFRLVRTSGRLWRAKTGGVEVFTEVGKGDDGNVKLEKVDWARISKLRMKL